MIQAKICLWAIIKQVHFVIVRDLNMYCPCATQVAMARIGSAFEHLSTFTRIYVDVPSYVNACVSRSKIRDLNTFDSEDGRRSLMT